MSYHEIIDPPWLDAECLSIGRLGAMNYIIDVDGERLTSGHHELYMNGNVVFGKLGAGTERIGTIENILKKKAKLNESTIQNVMLTKREHFAIEIFKAMEEASPHWEALGYNMASDEDQAKTAISKAETLLEELEKDK